MAEQDDTPFLSRWARRKQEAQRQDHKDHKNHKDQPAASAEQAMPAQTPGTDAGAAGVGPPDTAPIEAAFDPATLPKIDDLTPESDIAAFLREGVPAEIKRLALRRMWSLDPQIRDFIEVAENQYDWNAVDGVPGFGALPAGTDVQALVAQATGRLQQIAQPTLPSVVAEPIPERETSPGCATATGVTPHAGRATTEGHAHEKAPDPTGASVELPSRPRIGAASTSDGEQPQRTFRRRHGGALPEQATSDKNA